MALCETPYQEVAKMTANVAMPWKKNHQPEHQAQRQQACAVDPAREHADRNRRGGAHVRKCRGQEAEFRVAGMVDVLEGRPQRGEQRAICEIQGGNQQQQRDRPARVAAAQPRYQRTKAPSPSARGGILPM